MVVHSGKKFTNISDMFFYRIKSSYQLSVNFGEKAYQAANVIVILPKKWVSVNTWKLLLEISSLNVAFLWNCLLKFAWEYVEKKSTELVSFDKCTQCYLNYFLQQW